MLLHARQIAIQAAALLIYLALAWPYFGFRGEELPWPESAYAIGACALLVASLSRQPWWWRLIHLAFVPLLWKTSQLGIEPGWFLLALIALLLVYRGALGGRIPLFLSSDAAIAALGEIIRERQARSLLDLGAGIASVTAPLATENPDLQLSGIENAPASWLLGYLRTRGLKNCRWKWGSLWQTSLADTDVVYAFLSPEPMPQLWQKAKAEMRPGSLFVSNSFPIPEIEADLIVELDGQGNTCLYCYEISPHEARITE